MKRGGRVAVAAAVALGLGAGCPQQERARAAGALVGCYQFERNAGARALGLPWGVELQESGLGPGWPLLSDRAGARRAATATSATAREDHPFAYWAPAAADSIEIGHPGGGGIVLTLAVIGADLIGAGAAAGDAVPLGGSLQPRAPVPVVARRVLCGAR